MWVLTDVIRTKLTANRDETAMAVIIFACGTVRSYQATRKTRRNNEKSG